MAYTKAELKDHRAKWVEALRSGDYLQTIGKLRKDDSYCCLGVLCEISGLITWEKDEADGGLSARPQKGDSRSGVLPLAVIDWIGLRTVNGSISDHCALSTCNDAGMDFHNIADIIESEPGGLFR